MGDNGPQRFVVCKPQKEKCRAPHVAAEWTLPRVTLSTFGGGRMSNVRTVSSQNSLHTHGELRQNARLARTIMLSLGSSIYLAPVSHRCARRLARSCTSVFEQPLRASSVDCLADATETHMSPRPWCKLLPFRALAGRSSAFSWW